jgi:hypothetical protein
VPGCFGLAIPYLVWFPVQTTTSPELFPEVRVMVRFDADQLQGLMDPVLQVPSAAIVRDPAEWNEPICSDQL